FVFLADSKASLGPLQVGFTTFRVKVRTRLGVDLTEVPFTRYRRRLTSPTRYVDTQALGSAIREAGGQVILFTSARDPERGTNLAALAPDVLRGLPLEETQWQATITDHLFSVRTQSLTRTKAGFSFSRESFEVAGGLPRPA
ncbi:MAG: RES family NAD+ phosphorylase, partial [Myxococcota bacterium]